MRTKIGPFVAEQQLQVFNRNVFKVKVPIT